MNRCVAILALLVSSPSLGGEPRVWHLAQPGAKYIALSADHVATADDDRIVIRRRDGLEAGDQLDAPGRVASLSFDRHGNLVVATRDDAGKLSAHQRSPEGRWVGLGPVNTGVTGRRVALSPNGKHALVQDAALNIRLIDRRTGNTIRELAEFRGILGPEAFDATGLYAAWLESDLPPWNSGKRAGSWREGNDWSQRDNRAAQRRSERMSPSSPDRLLRCCAPACAALFATPEDVEWAGVMLGSGKDTGVRLWRLKPDLRVPALVFLTPDELKQRGTVAEGHG